MAEEIAKKSELLDDDMRAQIQSIFGKLTKDLTMVACVDLEEEKSRELVALLYDLESLGEHIHLTILQKGDQPQKEAEFDSEGRTPAVGMYLGECFTGVAFYGVPGGQEMNSFLLACYNIAGPGQEVSKWTQKKLTKLKKESQMKIFVSLSCHHCAQTVISAQHLAAMSPKLTAVMIDANLYPDYVEKYKIERVPMIIINEEKVLMGEKSLDDLAAILE